MTGRTFVCRPGHGTSVDLKLIFSEIDEFSPMVYLSTTEVFD